MSLRQIQNPWKSDVFTTAGAVAAGSVPTSFSPPSGASGYAEMIANGRVIATGLCSTVKIGQSWKNVAGTVTLSGLGTILVTGASGDAATTLVAVFLATGGTTLTPTVTGIAATPIEWLLDVRYWVN
jgi:hypothetical protein